LLGGPARGAPRPGARGAGIRRPRRPRRPSAERDVGRPAAARGDRARAGQPAADPARRRTHRCPRLAHRRGDPGAVQAPARRRPHRGHHHPRRRGRGPRRPHLRDARRGASRRRAAPAGGAGMSLLDILRTAAFALRGNWMRSALTSLGVIIGIAAVIVMVSVGQGTQQEIDKLVSGLGSQRLDISPGAQRGPGGARQSAGSFYTLTEGDVEAIREEIPEVQYVAGALRGGTQVVYAENNAATSWQGVQPDWFAINDWKLAEGSLFEPQAYTGAAKQVVLGDSVRRVLFGEDSGIGETIRLGRVPFTVVGTLAPKGQGSFGQDQDDVVMVPLSTARRRLLGTMGLPPGA